MELPDLYPAQVGSPYTTLAAPYTSGESTMTLVDATKLPTAPNIVCLAGDVAGEFTYTGKVGNILKGVTALPGTPAATTWPAGTFAFRGIAAYDLNAIHENMVRTATYVVAASDAPAHVKRQADYVCDGVDDHVEIQAAIDSLSNGGNIIITQGTYTISDILTLSSMSDITITGVGNPTINRNYTGEIASHNVHTIKLTKCNRISIQGIKFTQTDAHTGEIIRIRGSDSITVENCVFDGCYNGVRTMAYSGDNTKCTNVTISKNHILNYKYCGIGLSDGSEYITVSHNTIHDGNNPDGELLYAIATSTMGASVRDLPGCHHVTITDNVIYNHTMHNAIDVHGGDDFVITGNILTNIAGDGIFCHNVSPRDETSLPSSDFDCKNWIISHNIISTAATGISITSDHVASTLSNVTICDNCISNVTSKGILVECVENAHLRNVAIENNTIRGHVGEYPYGYGIFAGSNKTGATCENITVRGNIIDDTDSDTPFENGIQVYTGDNVCVADNIVNGSRYGIYVQDRATSSGPTVVVNNVISNATFSGCRVNNLTSGCGSKLIYGNVIRNCSYGIYTYCEVETSDIVIKDNTLENCTYPIYNRSTLGGIPTISLNTGYVTESKGTATLANATTSITVAHGCSATPTNITVTPGSIGNATKWYVDTIGATTFTIHVDQDPGADITFYWRAEV